MWHLSCVASFEYGIPIATTVGGVAELVQNGKEGLLVRRGDAAGIADAMMTLLRSDESRRSERALAPAYAPAAASANPDPQ